MEVALFLARASRIAPPPRLIAGKNHATQPAKELLPGILPSVIVNIWLNFWSMPIKTEICPLPVSPIVRTGPF